MQDIKVYASIDLGTNACRLKIVSCDSKGLIKNIESYSKVIQFGESIRSQRKLSEEAITRGIETLKECSVKLSKYKIEDSLFVATEACRSAQNADEFLKRVYDESGINLKIISSSEEAYYGAIACHNLISGSYKYGVVFDIGGGSTEVALFECEDYKINVLNTISIPVGFITLDDPKNARIKNKKCQMMHESLHRFFYENKIGAKIAQNNLQLIGLSGTLNSIINLVLESDTYNKKIINGFCLRKSDIEKSLVSILGNNKQSLILQSNSSEDAFQIMQACKFKSIIISDSARILYQIYNIFRLPITIADRGVRDGILTYLTKYKNPVATKKNTERTSVENNIERKSKKANIENLDKDKCIDKEKKIIQSENEKEINSHKGYGEDSKDKVNTVYVEEIKTDKLNDSKNQDSSSIFEAELSTNKGSKGFTEKNAPCSKQEKNISCNKQKKTNITFSSNKSKIDIDIDDVLKEISKSSDNITKVPK